VDVVVVLGRLSKFGQVVAGVEVNVLLTVLGVFNRIQYFDRLLHLVELHLFFIEFLVVQGWRTEPAQAPDARFLEVHPAPEVHDVDRLVREDDLGLVKREQAGVVAEHDHVVEALALGFRRDHRILHDVRERDVPGLHHVGALDARTVGLNLAVVLVVHDEARAGLQVAQGQVLPTADEQHQFVESAVPLLVCVRKQQFPRTDVEHPLELLFDVHDDLVDLPVHQHDQQDQRAARTAHEPVEEGADVHLLALVDHFVHILQPQQSGEQPLAISTHI